MSEAGYLTPETFRRAIDALAEREHADAIAVRDHLRAISDALPRGFPDSSTVLTLAERAQARWLISIMQSSFWMPLHPADAKRYGAALDALVAKHRRWSV